MKKLLLSIAFMLCINAWATDVNIDDIIRDIYEKAAEDGEQDFEDWQQRLNAYLLQPININQTNYDELAGLGFLNSKQIDEILLYVYEHPMTDIQELKLIRGLKDYELRNLLPFVYVGEAKANNKMYAADVFRFAKHDIMVRADATNLEEYTRTKNADPTAAQVRYKFNYQNKVQFGAHLKRPRGGKADELMYGGYVQLNDIGPMRTIVAGNFQAEFGQGLVLSGPFHNSRSSYVLNAGISRDDLRKYTSTNGAGMHGVGATAQFIKGKNIFSLTALYSIKRVNDSTLLHTVGGNFTYRRDRLKIGVTAIGNIYSDSLQYYFKNAKYNQNYFRGDRQAVVGLNWRYNWGIVDWFGEAAAAQNTKWGYGIATGVRIYPVSDVGLVVLYRYYSPTFDNPWGYAYSRTSRINDENGLYLGCEVKRLKDWRFSLYGDLFRFSGIKYGIPYSPSWGYEAQGQAEWIKSTFNMLWRFNARQKAKKDTYAFRYQFNWKSGGWHLRSHLEGNLVKDSLKHIGWGYAIYQDVHYSFSNIPLVLQLRLQWFDARQWDNRIYCYENDVLYGYSIPALYGQGGRFYLNIRWKIIPQLSLYLRVSETIYTSLWLDQYNATHGSNPKDRSDTDIHLLLRAVL